MIIRWLDAETKERQKSLAAILKNGSHFVFGTNLRWPYILKSLLGHILSLCQISNFYHKVHDSLKFWRIPLPLSLETYEGKFNQSEAEKLGQSVTNGYFHLVYCGPFILLWK